MIGRYDRKKKLTPLVLAGIFVLMLGLSYAAVPFMIFFVELLVLEELLKYQTKLQKLVLDKVVSVRFDTNVNNLPWDFKAKSNVMDVKVGQVKQN